MDTALDLGGQHKKIRGFTLLELSTVVAIIGVLSSIAIPNYISFQQRSKTAEAMIAMETIAYLEQVQLLEYGDVIACEPNPPTVPSAGREPFVATPSWEELGFSMAGRVYFQYEVRRPAPETFVIIARGDLDGDGELSHFELPSSTMQIKATRPIE